MEKENEKIGTESSQFLGNVFTAAEAPVKNKRVVELVKVLKMAGKDTSSVEALNLSFKKSCELAVINLNAEKAKGKKAKENLILKEKINSLLKKALSSNAPASASGKALNKIINTGVDLTSIDCETKIQAIIEWIRTNRKDIYNCDFSEKEVTFTKGDLEEKWSFPTGWEDAGSKVGFIKQLQSRRFHILILARATIARLLRTIDALKPSEIKK